MTMSSEVLETDRLIDQDDRDAAGIHLAVDDQNLVDPAGDALGSLSSCVLEEQRILVDATKALINVGHDLLRADDENDPPRTRHVGPS